MKRLWIAFSLLLEMVASAAPADKMAKIPIVHPPDPEWFELEALVGLPTDDPRVRSFASTHHLEESGKGDSGSFFRSECSFSPSYEGGFINSVRVRIKEYPGYGPVYKQALPFNLEPSDGYSKVERKLGTIPLAAYFPSDLSGTVTKVLVNGNEFQVHLSNDRIVEISCHVPWPVYKSAPGWTWRETLSIPLALSAMALTGLIVHRKRGLEIKKVANSLLYGTAITLFVSLFSHERVSGGIGFGWPFTFVARPYAWTHCDWDIVFNGPCLLLDLLLWSAIAFPVRLWVLRRFWPDNTCQSACASAEVL